MLLMTYSSVQILLTKGLIKWRVSARPADVKDLSKSYYDHIEKFQSG